MGDIGSSSNEPKVLTKFYASCGLRHVFLIKLYTVSPLRYLLGRLRYSFRSTSNYSRLSEMQNGWLSARLLVVFVLKKPAIAACLGLAQSQWKCDWIAFYVRDRSHRARQNFFSQIPSKIMHFFFQEACFKRLVTFTQHFDRFNNRTKQQRNRFQ